MPLLVSIPVGDQELGAPNGYLFEPSTQVGNLSTFADYNQALPSLRSKLTVSLVQPSKTSKLNKARIKLVLVNEGTVYDPVTSTYVPNKTARAVCSADVTFIFPENSTDTDRVNLLQHFISALQNNAVDEVITSCRPFY